MNIIEFQQCLLIIVYNADRSKLLFIKDSLRENSDVYNVICGKASKDEAAFSAAYRELFVKSGICEKDIVLSHLMDNVCFNTEKVYLVFAGVLLNEVDNFSDKNNLCWLDADKNDFYNRNFGVEAISIENIISQINEFGFGPSDKVLIKRIDEADYGCEEKFDSKVYDIVTVWEDNTIKKYNIDDKALLANNINEGSIISKDLLGRCIDV